MVKMTGEERKVADFLTENKFDWEFQPSVSVKDMGNRPRLFSPDFYLPDLDIYIEVCGAERDDHYQRTREIYKKNKVTIIFIETYKGANKWQPYLIRRIKEIQDKRQLAVSSLPNEINSKPIEEKPKPVPKNTPPKVIGRGTEKQLAKNNVISIQSILGFFLLFLGIVFLIVTLIYSVSQPSLTTLILFIISVILLYVGGGIVKRRFRKWYRPKKEKYNKWLNK